MVLSQLISVLEHENPDKMCPIGFKHPHSYRGYYHDLAFEIANDVSVKSMLKDARRALGNIYQGWKGGDFEMKEFTDCHLVREEGECGETLGPVLLSFMLGHGGKFRYTGNNDTIEMG